MRRLVMISALLFVSVLLAALTAQTPEPEGSRLAHGRYLVEEVALCVECHTPRNSRGELDRTRMLQGAPIPLQSPFRSQRWAFQAPSIAGLPGWSTPDALILLQTGSRVTGLSPKRPMPPYRMTQGDAAAVVAYLKSMR